MPALNNKLLPPNHLLNTNRRATKYPLIRIDAFLNGTFYSVYATEQIFVADIQ